MRSLLYTLALLASSTLAGYLVSLGLWNLIVFPFNNPFDVVGKLALAKFNPINNYFRWLLFVIAPSAILVYLLTFRKTLEKVTPAFHNLKQPINTTGDTPHGSVSGVKKFVESPTFPRVTFMFATSILIYLFLTHNWSTSSFDMFHEGEQLTPAINYLLGKGIWTGSLFVHGAFYDIFTAVLGWRLFDVTTIGAYRVAVEIMVLLKDLGLLLLLYILTKTLMKALNNTRSALFLSTLILTFYLFTLRLHNTDRRMLPFIITLCCLFVGEFSKSRKYYFLAGVASILGLFYSLDVGIYGFIISLSYIFLLRIFKISSIKEVTRSLVVYVLGLGLATTCVFIVVGKVEFNQFIEDFIYFLKVKDLLDSYIYPFPNLFAFPRTTIPVFISAFNTVVFVLLLFVVYLRNNSLRRLALIHATLLLASLVLYRTALGRSDLLHIETSSSFVFAVLGLSVGLLIIFTKGTQKLTEPILYSSLFLNVLFTLFVIVKTDPSNMFTFSQRTAQFVKTDNLEFINPERRDGVRRLRDIFDQESCVLNLTSEAVTPYLLNRPSCGRIYISYFASGEPIRSDLMSTVKDASPEYILYSSKNWTQNLDNITNLQRFPDIMSYIEDSYVNYETVSDYWVIYRKISSKISI